MPGCSAVYCSNSSKKGFLMKRFPRDPVRRKEWHLNMRRGNWEPTDFSYLCEVHFAPEMWEKTREDGSRKLRFNAVPTIFSFSSPKQKRKISRTPRKSPILKTKTTSSGKNIACDIEEDKLTDPNLGQENMDGGIEAEPTKSNPDQENIVHNPEDPPTNSSPGQANMDCNLDADPTTSSPGEDSIVCDQEDQPTVLGPGEKVIAIVIEDKPTNSNSGEKNIVGDVDNKPTDSAPGEKNTICHVKQVTTTSTHGNKSSLSKLFSKEELRSLTSLPHEVRTATRKELLAQLCICEKKYLREKFKAMRYKRELINTRKSLESLKRKIEIASNTKESSLLHGLFNSDQITALRKVRLKKSTKFMKWSAETVTKALRLKLHCGNNGYKELLKQGYPLPSIRTLQRIKFDRGVINEIFDILKTKL